MSRVHEALARARSVPASRQGDRAYEGPASPETSSQAFRSERETDADNPQNSSAIRAGDLGAGLAPEVAQVPVGPPRGARPQEPHVNGTDVLGIVPATHAGGAKRCPHCDALSDSRKPPAFLRWSYRLAGKPMHRCRACRRRYHTPMLAARPSKVGRPMPGFLPPSNGRSFQDLVREMARDERDWQFSEERKRSR